MEAFNYQFSALRGIQAGREYYLAMCPLKLIAKIFLFDEEEIPPELRAQRVLNRARVPDIARYLLDNPKDYVFSALTISIDGDVHFEPSEKQGYKRNTGLLSVPMTARFLINDGQHRRAGIELRQKEIAQTLDQTREAIRELAAGLLPFAVAPQWSTRLRARLVNEAQAEQARLIFDTQEEQAAHAALTLLLPSFQKQTAPQVEPQAWVNIAEAVQRLLAPPPVASIGATRHPISGNERAILLAWIDESLTQVPERLHALGMQLEALETEQARLELALKQIPTEAVAAPLLDEFHRVVEEKGRLDVQFAQIADDVRQLDFQLLQFDRERLAAWEQVAAAGEGDMRVQRAAKAQVVLDQYLRQITERKMEELEHAIAHYFNLLCRKQMLVREVKIDPHRFLVTLYGVNRTVLPKSDLSAGEKQLYATALLWALRAVSGRALPIIIDTPMGRLDSDHRDIMLRDFFPNAAHQVILLSTDTEIDPQAFAKIQHAVSHTFRLEFDQTAGYTRVEPGYFEPQLHEETV